MLRFAQGKAVKDQINSLLGYWDIAAFDYGKLDGNAYGNRFSKNYDPNCTCKVIIELD
jgi:hypothetical protein